MTDRIIIQSEGRGITLHGGHYSYRTIKTIVAGIDDAKWIKKPMFYFSDLTASFEYKSTIFLVETIWSDFSISVIGNDFEDSDKNFVFEHFKSHKPKWYSSIV